MIEVRKTDEFDSWLDSLKDKTGKANVVARIRRLGFGNPGDAAPVGDGISEMRVHAGPGYRIYYEATGKMIVPLLCGGDKASQTKDVKRAKPLAADISENDTNGKNNRVRCR